MQLEKSVAKRISAAVVLWALVGAAPPVQAQDATHIDVLQQLNGSIGSLVERVSQSVVQVLVTSYVPVEQGNHGDTDVQIVYPKLRRYGYLHRGQIGVSLQTITPTLAAGLDLAQDWGVMISDVTPGSPADKAGLKPEDIVLAIDGKPIEGLPRLTFGEAEMVDTGLNTGDTIHTLNGKPVTSVPELRALLKQLKSGSPVVLQIERAARLMFLSFELD